MPHSLVLNLLPAFPIPTGYLSGKHLHALFLTLVSSVDKALGNHLHEQKTEKAFTLSPLQVSQNPDRELQWDYRHPIPVGKPCWWRISLLDDALFGHLSQLWLNLNPSKPWHLGPADLQIVSILGTPQSTQPWANYCAYSQFYEQASEAASLRSGVLFRRNARPIDSAGLCLLRAVPPTSDGRNYGSLRQAAIATIQAVTTLLETGQMPPAVYLPRCQGCSLYRQCLPKAALKVSQYREG